jgi:hypothetical protein
MTLTVKGFSATGGKLDVGVVAGVSSEPEQAYKVANDKATTQSFNFMLIVLVYGGEVVLHSESVSLAGDKCVTLLIALSLAIKLIAARAIFCWAGALKGLQKPTRIRS